MEEHDKQYKIIVNAQEKTWGEKEISYDEVVILAFGSVSDDPNVNYRVTYAKSADAKKEGSLGKGQSVKIKNGTVFNVRPANRA